MSASDPVTWTVPLRISVFLGTPALASGALAPASGAVVPPLLSTPTPKPADRSLREGLFRAKEPDPFDEASRKFSLDALARAEFSWPAALDTALASDLAYRPVTDVQTIARSRWAFEDCRPIAMGSTECFVASAAEAVVVAFRGTQEIADWLVNLDVAWTTTDYGTIHRGFYGAFQSVRASIEEALGPVGAGKKPLIITGHSLGGALATIAAAVWYGRYNVSAVYTFGQPAVGFSNFRSYLDVRYPTTFYRFVNEDDVVPRVPPGYRHVGRLIHFTGQGRVGQERAAALESTEDTPTMDQVEFEQLKARLQAARTAAPASMNETVRANAFQEGFFPSVADHSLSRYLREILSQLV